MSFKDLSGSKEVHQKVEKEKTYTDISQKSAPEGQFLKANPNEMY